MLKLTEIKLSGIVTIPLTLGGLGDPGNQNFVHCNHLLTNFQ